MKRRLSMKHTYCLCLALSNLLMLLGCTQEPDDGKMISISVADIQPYEEKVWGAVTFENRQNRWAEIRERKHGEQMLMSSTHPQS